MVSVQAPERPLTPFLSRRQDEPVAVAELEADYLVVGAGAVGMAFTDALVDHADVSVVMVDRRYGVGGHWLDAYPFVRLHQASSFYGVASTLLGGGSLQHDGPEAGLHERAAAPEVCAYYERVLRTRLLASGKVCFYSNCDYLGEGRFVSRVSGRHHKVRGRRRIVDARYLSPSIPATTPPPYGIADGVTAVPVNDLVTPGGAPSEYVIAGSGKTATDACIWLLDKESIPAPSAGYAPGTRGCSTARWSSRTLSSSSARRLTSWRQPPPPRLQMTCSSSWRRPA